ncbi:hypothetical protein QCA50_001191 [Cerrena zonata]
MPFNFTLDTFQAFRSEYVLSDWYNSRAYGSPNMARRAEELPAKYWKMSQAVWTQFLETMTDEQQSFTGFIHWMATMIDPTDNMKAFYQVGDLIGMLIAGDLAYADIINKPTVEEMGKLVAKVSKGAVGGLVYLQLVE